MRAGEGGMCGEGTRCIVGVCMAGGLAWEVCMAEEGCAWWGACMAGACVAGGGMCGRGGHA